ncbi:MAG: glycosyltransferase [Alistipes sp.]|nr:glycosyltransferase [Alistipes sp.]
MQILDYFLSQYGNEGAVLVLLLLGLFVAQLICAVRYGRAAGYKNNRRKVVREENPPLSLVVPMFSEDYGFVEERLPLLLGQEYAHFEVIVVYVGQDSDFHEELTRLRQHYPHLIIARIHHDPRYPISRKMALNIGIKSAHHECMLFTSTDVVPRSPRWLTLMAKGFTRGDIVLGYCGLERKKGLLNRLFRMGRMMRSATWLSRAAKGIPYRDILHNFGFTKSVYFSPRSNGFNHLGMNIGEDDLFIQAVATKANTSVILSPAASVDQKVWGGLRWWLSQLTYYGSTVPFYPLGVRLSYVWELLTRVAFFAVAVLALVWMPLEYQLAVVGLVLLRYLLVWWQVRRLARRLGERGLLAGYFLYDLFSPLWSLFLGLLLLRKDRRVWR